MITDDQIRHVAHLARLELSPDEVGRYRRELVAVLEFVEILKGADIEGVDHLRTISGILDVIRNDEPQEDPMRRPEGPSLIEQAPDRRDGYVRTRGVFDRGQTNL